MRTMNRGDMMNTTILIDGNNLCYRCCSTMGQLSTKSGVKTGGIFGTLNCISNYITDIEKLVGSHVTECVVAFDHGRSERRLKLYPEYKGTRKTSDERTPEEKEFFDALINQTSELNKNLYLIGVKTIQIVGWEADDLIYGMIRQSLIERSDEENQFVIISSDEDFLQLIDENTSVYSPIKKIFYTYKNFEELFGCKPEYFIGYKILKGDSSDNIHGINGIGDVTGKKLVNEYGGLVGILNPANAEQLKKSKVSARILTPEGLSTIQRNNELINLKEFVDFTNIEEQLSDVVYDSPSVDEKGTREFLMKYQLSSILVKFKEWIRPFKNLVENYYSS